MTIFEQVSDYSEERSQAKKGAHAYVRQRSGMLLDLLAPDPFAWTDEDAAIGLSRTFRWGGHSATAQWPLSVAQHSLTVLALEIMLTGRPLTRMEILRSICHDLDESLVGGFDAITPLKPFLGPGFTAVTDGLKHAISIRYRLQSRTPQEYQIHKQADVLAAASEAVHVVGWSKREIKELLGIDMEPLFDDPISLLYACDGWTPWPAEIAAQRYLAELTGAADAKFHSVANQDRIIKNRLRSRGYEFACN